MHDRGSPGPPKKAIKILYFIMRIMRHPQARFAPLSCTFGAIREPEVCASNQGNMMAARSAAKDMHDTKIC